MTSLSDLNAAKRREHIRLTLDLLLRRAEKPAPTADLVVAIAEALGEPKAKHLIARALVDLAPEHPAASQTGEVFERFGRPMRRWMWSPLDRKRTESAREIEARRARQRALEDDDDEWTVRPDPGAFLEDEG